MRNTISPTIWTSDISLDDKILLNGGLDKKTLFSIYKGKMKLKNHFQKRHDIYRERERESVFTQGVKIKLSKVDK